MATVPFFSLICPIPPPASTAVVCYSPLYGHLGLWQRGQEGTTCVSAATERAHLLLEKAAQTLEKLADLIYGRYPYIRRDDLKSE